MTPELLILVGLFFYLVIRDLVYTIQIQKLVNKVMSRNYHDYMFSSHISKTMEEKVKPSFREPGEREDLAPIQEFGIN